MDRHKPLREALALVAHNTPSIELERLSRRLEAAGIVLTDDLGNWLDAEHVIDQLDAPDITFNQGFRFELGWTEASRDFWFGADGECPDTGEYLHDLTLEGADHYRAVYKGLERLLEVAPWRDMPSVPSDDIAHRNISTGEAA